jgi:riboflavin synthase
MFTGLVESLGEVTEVNRTAGGLRLGLSTELATQLGDGDSLAVNGVCLTVVSTNGRGIYADVSPETSRVTTFGSIADGAIVNLERPLRADARLGGHFVQGHVDGTGVIEDLRQDGDSYWLTVTFPPALAPAIVRKGSIAVDGISLTVASVDERRFDVQIIPYTWAETNLHTREAGQAVNLECDILGKYVTRALELTGLGAKTGPQ